MILNTDAINYLCKRMEITLPQLFVISAIYHKDFSSIRDRTKDIPPEDIDALVSKGLLINTNMPGQRYADRYMLSDKCVASIGIASGLCGEELWKTYPWSFESGDKVFPAKTVDKDALIKLYLRRIGNSMATHRKVMRILIRLVEAGGIKMGIEKWVGSEQWNAAADDIKSSIGPVGPTQDAYDLLDDQ